MPIAVEEAAVEERKPMAHPPIKVAPISVDAQVRGTAPMQELDRSQLASGRALAIGAYSLSEQPAPSKAWQYRPPLGRRKEVRRAHSGGGVRESGRRPLNSSTSSDHTPSSSDPRGPMHLGGGEVPQPPTQPRAAVPSGT